MQEHVSLGYVAQGRWSLRVHSNTVLTHWVEERTKEELRQRSHLDQEGGLTETF